MGNSNLNLNTSHVDRLYDKLKLYLLVVLILMDQYIRVVIEVPHVHRVFQRQWIVKLYFDKNRKQRHQ
jgi:hypothetical protein